MRETLELINQMQVDGVIGNTLSAEPSGQRFISSRALRTISTSSFFCQPKLALSYRFPQSTTISADGAAYPKQSTS